MASGISKRIAAGSAIFLYFLLALAGCGGGSDTSYPFAELNMGDGLGALAEFSSPSAITTDNSYLYVADSGNNTIRKILISNGFVTTLAGKQGVAGVTDAVGGAARFYSPFGIAAYGANLFVADTTNNYIRQVVISNGAVSTLVKDAGELKNPQGIAVSSDGANLFVADTTNNVIRKVDAHTGAVSIFAGSATTSGFTDNSDPAASLFHAPEGVVIVGNMLYVTDTDNNAIRQININTGVVSTLAGSAVLDSSTTPPTPTAALAGNSDSTDGTGQTAQFNSPSGITTDGVSFLYVTDTGNHTIRVVSISTGAVTTLAGTAGTSGSTNGTGGAALFNSPFGITYVGGNLYVADTNNNLIRKVVIATGKVTTLAGGAATP